MRSETVAAPAPSQAMLLAGKTKAERTAFFQAMTLEDGAGLRWTWEFWARPDQLAPPGDWLIWLLMTGRGFGKTRAGGAWVHREAMAGGPDRHIALIGQTPGDVRDDMIEGLGGILKNVPPWEEVNYEPSKRRLTWPTGAFATIYSGANPEQVRGFSGDRAWCDELAAWQYPRETWDQLMFGMREARIDQPRICVTTTPKPIALLKQLRDSPATHVTVGTSYDNRANLSEVYYQEVIAPYEGTMLGQQEIYARLLEEDPRALWSREQLDLDRRNRAPAMARIVVGVDPQARAEAEHSATGIVVAGIDNKGQGYVLEDRTCSGKPNVWGGAAVAAYHDWKADRILGEINNGGDMVEHVIRTVDPMVSYKEVHASRGKQTRAEPIAALYEQHRIHHVSASGEDFEELESQMVSWVPSDPRSRSPHRIDALVWALSDLMLGKGAPETPPPLNLAGLTKQSRWRT